MSPILLLGSLVAVLALGLAARWLGLGGGRIESADEACRIAGEALPEFAAERAWVSAEGMSAVAIGGDGLALIKQHGTQPAVRFVARPVSAEVEGDDLILVSGDRMFGPLRLRLAAEERDKLLTLL
jgi:hypothetical protein